MSITRIYLNGYWDILPLFGRQIEMELPDEVKSEEFVKGKYIVPGMFCLLHDYNNNGMFNSFNYPDEWNQTRDAWLHKEFRISKDCQNKRIFLHFGAIVGHSRIWVNNSLVGENIDSTMPIDIDITDHIKFDDTNELSVRVEDLPRTEQGNALIPTAGIMINRSAGIWQDVYLDIKEPAYISDYYYKTSYKNRKIDFQIELDSHFTVQISGLLRLSVRDRSGKQKQLEKNVTVESESVQKVYFEMDAEDINYWSAENPYLYELSIELEGEEGRLLDVIEKKIGFKEIWIDGPHFYVNGKKTHFYGDWGHRVHCYQQRAEYIRCWFGMLKDVGMNYVRLHTGPHDPIIYEIANEMGIYICCETALHGSGRGLATEQQEFWDNAREHVQRFVRRDRSQVCIVLWSAGNEMRHNPPLKLTVKELPEVAKVIKTFDPTRPVYFEGDSSLWDESPQEIVSRHYGDIAGGSWWDKTQPLHVGEMGKWHYGQPPENVMLGGNKVYESLWDSHEAVGLEAAILIERARINDVSSLFPWNLSCLDNPSLPETDVTLTWDNLEEPGPKPSRVCAFSSEFHWWDDKKDRYNKGSSFDLISNAFKPETVFIWERQAEYFVESTINRTLTVINDTESDYDYELKLSVYDTDNKLVKEDKHKLKVTAGGRKTISLAFNADDNAGNMRLVVDLSRDGKLIKQQSQEICICENKPTLSADVNIPILKVFGDGSLDEYFNSRRLKVQRVQSLDNLSADDILIIEKDSVKEEKAFVDSLAEFVQHGGRVLLLEQFISILKDVEIKSLSVIQAHAQSIKLENAKLSWWGQKAFLGHLGQDFVARYGYKKPKRGNFCSWVDIGNGDFGEGGLCWSA